MSSQGKKLHSLPTSSVSHECLTIMEDSVEHTWLGGLPCAACFDPRCLFVLACSTASATLCFSITVPMPFHSAPRTSHFSIPPSLERRKLTLWSVLHHRPLSPACVSVSGPAI